MAIPKVSVIVPVYKVEKYLRQCLDSLVAQSLKEIEFILINDGSPDNCGEILREYAARYPQFKLIEQANKGYAGARNAAFSHATGEYIGFVDSDDWVAPDMFEKLWQQAHTHDADVSECSFWRYFEIDNVYIPYDTTPQIKLLACSGGKLKGAEAMLFDDAVTWYRIYRRSMLEKYEIRFREEMTMGEDICLFLESVCVANKIVVIPDCLYYYRNQRPGQQTSFNDERLYSFFTLFDIFGAFVKKHGLEYLEPWILHLRLSRYCYGYENAKPEIREAYFQQMRHALLDAGVTRQSRIAPGCCRYGGISHRLRYLLLRILHPLTLRAILDGNRKRFDRIIAFRVFLLNLPRLCLKILRGTRTH